MLIISLCTKATSEAAIYFIKQKHNAFTQKSLRRQLEPGSPHISMHLLHQLELFSKYVFSSVEENYKIPDERCI